MPRTSAAAPRARVLSLGLLAGTSVALVAAHLARPATGLGDATYLASLLVSSAAAWHGVALLRRPLRRAWSMVALGVTLSASADLAYYVVYWSTGTEPDLSVADVLWIASYAALGLGLLRLAPGRGARRGDVDAVIDSLVPAVLALLLLWEVALDALVADTTASAVARAVWTAYPVMDVLLLALVVRLAILHRRTRSWALVLLAAGIVSWLLADIGYLFAASRTVLAWLDVGWMAASALLAAAVLARGRTSPTPLPAAPAGHRGRMWPVMVPLLVPAVVEVRGFLRGEDANAFALGLVTAALVGLASLRGHRLLRAAERSRADVQAREAHYRAIAAHSTDAALVVDEGGRITETSGNLGRLVGRPGEEVLGETVGDAVAGCDRDAIATYLASVGPAPGSVAEHEVEVRHADGTTRWLTMRVVNLLADPAVGGLVVNLEDVTARRRAQDELAHHAFHDGLTGLAGHALFSDRIDQALRRSARTGARVAVLYLDVDGFKSVNDRLGHAAGDHVLREVADRLRATVRSADTVARLGGDELAVLVEEAHADAEQARTTADRILQALSVPVEVDGQLIAISASIGVAVGDVAQTAADLIRQGDLAMCRAKAAGKARVVLFDATMELEAGDAARIEADLPHAVARGQLELHYQPVVELASTRLGGFEALVRWRHPELGLVPPDRFIPLAEATGAIVPIGRWVLDAACDAAVRWRHAGDGAAPLTMAVNLSAVQLATDAIVDDVRHALARTGLEPELLVLEITETGLVTDPSAAADRLRALRALGVRLAIDDFGTGYSSLAYLRQFPVDILKIDRSFIDTITGDGALPPIVRGLLDLARALDLETVAEGIELEVQHESLGRAACTMGQGFLYSRPIPEPEVDACLGAPDCPARTAVTSAAPATGVVHP